MGLETPAASAISSIEASWKPRSANSRPAVSSICGTRTARGTLRGPRGRVVGGSLGWTPAIVSSLAWQQLVHWSYRSNALGHGARMAAAQLAEVRDQSPQRPRRQVQ